MGIAQAIALAWKILGVVGTILGIANTIDSKPLAEEGHPLEIQTAVLATGQFLVDPALGIPRVISNQAALLAALGSVQSTLLAAIGSPQQSGSPVTFPTVPPTGYGGPTTSAIGDAVWLYATGFPSGTALGALSEVRYHAVNQDVGEIALPTSKAPPWSISGPFYDHRFTPDPRHQDPAIDFSTILGSDATPVDWLNRAYPGFGFATNDVGVPFFNGGDNYVYSIIGLTQPSFDRIKAEMFPPSIVGAPVWPGIAGVTLGAPVALSPTCVVTGPMHGVIIDITSAAPRQIYQVFGGMQGYRFVGGLQFVDDNGEAERIQSIGMQHEVILCKSMAEAASCSIRTDSAVAGTATPFVIT